MSTRKFGSRAVDAARWAGDRLGQLDDVVQGDFRYLLGERDGHFVGEGPISSAGAALGNYMHLGRHQVDDTWQGKAYLVGTRALQAGGATAAAYGLYNLGAALGRSLGDKQTPQELEV